MQRSGRRGAPRSRATLRPREFTRPQTGYPPRARCGRIQKQTPRSRSNTRTFKEKDAAYLNIDARDVESPATLPGLEKPSGELHRKEIIHSCSEASLEFVKLASLDTDADTNTLALNLMDYFLFSEENWLPELSYCKLHAACFLFASRLTKKDNSIEQISDSLGPDSAFVQLVGSTLAEDEASAAAIQRTISVSASDVEDCYALLYERKETFAYLLGQYSAELKNLPTPQYLTEDWEAAGEQQEVEDFDVFEA